MRWPWKKKEVPVTPPRTYCFLRGNGKWSSPLPGPTSAHALRQWATESYRDNTWIQDPIEQAWVLPTCEHVLLHCRYSGPNTLPTITYEDPGIPFKRYGKQRKKKKS